MVRMRSCIPIPRDIASPKFYTLLVCLWLFTFAFIVLLAKAWSHSENDQQNAEQRPSSKEIGRDPKTHHFGTEITEQNVTTMNETPSELKYFHFSTEDPQDGIKWSPKMRSLQAEREPLGVHIRVFPWEQSVFFAHHDPKVDLYVSGALSRGSMFEESSVIAVASHLDLILSALQVPVNDLAPHQLGFIDIGANLGVYSAGLGARFLHRFPSLDIFAFEPSDENLALLTSSLRQNGLSNVYLYPYGLTESGNLGDTVSFVVDTENKGHNHVEGNHSWSEHDGETVQIETVPLDVFTEILKDQHPEMYRSWSNAVWLKMDTEGLEPYIIRGGGKSLFSNSEMDPCFIKLEIIQHKEEIYTLLTNAGYEMVHFDWNSIAQQHRYSREEVTNHRDWDATFAKKDAEECVRRKLKNLELLH